MMWSRMKAEPSRAPSSGCFKQHSHSSTAQPGYPYWAVLEWECCLKHPEDGAREGSAFIRDHIIRVTERAFDDFAGSGVDQAANRRLLGLEGKAPRATGAARLRPMGATGWAWVGGGRVPS